MWHPDRSQWVIIWINAVLLILLWPPATGRSLGVKAIAWLADPTGALPSFPPPLPAGLADDGDAVAAHDELESEYYRRRDESRTTRWRMTLKDLADPLDRLTERQILIAIAVVSTLCVWMLDGRRRRSPGPRSG
jgi:hypothetical protein